jgi:hypothetical protein
VPMASSNLTTATGHPQGWCRLDHTSVNVILR